MKTVTVPISHPGHTPTLTSLNRSLRGSLLAASLSMLTLTSLLALGQCPAVELTAGLLYPTGMQQSSLGHLLVTENGTLTPNTGRISIVDLEGNRRTLVDGLPSARNHNGEPSGPTGLFLRGRTLYISIGEGDTAVGGAGAAVPNPNPPASPLFSSVLAIHFSASVELNTEGLTLSLADQQALADGEEVILSNGAGDQIAVELIGDFPNSIPFPHPTIPTHIMLSNPYDLVVVANQVYVTDGGRNLVWQVDIPTGAVSVLATFPNIPNPLFPVGGPTSQAVPTGIRYDDGLLLVALFRGVPFAPGTSVVEQLDPRTGNHAPLITGLKTAIDISPIPNRNETDYLVLQHASVGPFFGGPGLLLLFPGAGGPPTVVANCLNRPGYIPVMGRVSNST